MKKVIFKAVIILLVFMLCLSVLTPAAFAASHTAAPSKPVNIKLSASSYSTVRITWDKVDTASGYTIYRATTKKGTYREVANTTKLSFTNKKLKASTGYHYKVKAYLLNGTKKTYSGFSARAYIKTPKNLIAYYKSIQGSSLSKKKQKKLDNKVKSIIKEIITDNMTELEKANAIYNYILDNVVYEDKGWWINNANHAYGALVGGRAQCSGYSRALTLLCAQVGIECIYVKHKYPKQSGHKWSMIRIDGQYYHIDMQATDGDHDKPPDCVDMNLLHDITWQLTGDSNMDKYIYQWDKTKYPKCPKTYRTPEPPKEG